MLPPSHYEKYPLVTKFHLVMYVSVKFRFATGRNGPEDMSSAIVEVACREDRQIKAI